MPAMRFGLILGTVLVASLAGSPSRGEDAPRAPRIDIGLSQQNLKRIGYAFHYFHDAALSCVAHRQRLERLVESQHIDGRRPGRWRDLIQSHHRDVAAPFAGTPSPGVIDQDLTHQPGCHREEMRPVVERQAVNIHESQVDLVDQSRRLEGVAGVFPSKMRACYPAQLVMH